MRDKDRNERPLAAANGNEQREYNGRKKRVEIIWLQLNNKRICLATPARILANTATRCLLVAGGKWHEDGGMGQGARGKTGRVCVGALQSEHLVSIHHCPID